MEMTPANTPGSSSAKRTRAKPKATAKPSASETAAAKKPRAPRKTTTQSAPVTTPELAGEVLDSEQLDGMIATAAYYLAAARNFTPGHELDDWLEAERSIRARLDG